MSWFDCPHCGKPMSIFGSGGGEKLADELGVPLLGKIPLYPQVLAGGDAGQPIVVGESGSAAAIAIVKVAERVTEAYRAATT
jgi:ATP-binding protein involved in chromosome partitioning